MLLNSLVCQLNAKESESIKSSYLKIVGVHYMLHV